MNSDKLVTGAIIVIVTTLFGWALSTAFTNANRITALESRMLSINESMLELRKEVRDHRSHTETKAVDH